MIVLGVDPHGAKPYAFTVLLADGGAPIILAQGKGDLRSVDAIMETYVPDLVAVEDQYLSRNYKVAKALSQSAGKVLGAAELRKVRTTVVNVATWKARFGVAKGKGSHVAESVRRGGLDDDDVASSHLIALHAAMAEGAGDGQDEP